MDHEKIAHDIVIEILKQMDLTKLSSDEIVTIYLKKKAEIKNHLSEKSTSDLPRW